MVRFGFRVPSLSKRIAARTSIQRLVKNKLGLRAPQGWGWLTNPRKAAYNRVYNRTTRGCLLVLGFTLILHSRADDVVPFGNSVELLSQSGLPESALIDVGQDHRLADPQTLDALLRVVEGRSHHT